MNIGVLAPVAVATSAAVPTIQATNRTQVAVVIEWRGKVALFKRRLHLDRDGGMWHCVSGQVAPGATPKQQALEELLQETGLRAANLLDLRAGPALVINDNDGLPWLVHPFVALSSQRRLKIGREHDSYRWTHPSKVKRFSNRVPWLDSVLHAISSLTEPA